MRTRSHEPIVWSLFGAGGVFAALLGTMLVLIIGILVPMGLGFGPDAMHYDSLRSLFGHPLPALGLAVVISLFLFHGAHRIYHTLHDLGIPASKKMMLACYGSAAAGSGVALLLAGMLVVF